MRRGGKTESRHRYDSECPAIFCPQAENANRVLYRPKNITGFFYCFRICRKKKYTAPNIVTTAYAITGYKWGKASAKLPAITALSNSTAWTKGNAFAIFRNVPPTRSRSNHTPENQAETFVSRAPHMPPTAFTFNKLPHSNPKEM